jgi:uncharacterized protein
MDQEIPLLFGKTRTIEREIDEFLDKICEAGIYFEMGINAYLEENKVTEKCEMKLTQLSAVEDRCNELRRSIETALYTEMLIPDSAGDVLSLLEDLYYLIDIFEDNFQDLTIEEPNIPQEYHTDVKNLTKMAVKSVETIVKAARVFFRDPRQVREYLYKVGIYEGEPDTIAMGLKKRIFKSQLSLEHKMQLRFSIDSIDELADASEDVGDELSIYALKRIF